jgi:hypothetical protein
VTIATHGRGLVNADPLRYHDANDPAFPGTIASGMDVKGRAHWMRVGAWVRRFLERPSTERGRGLDGYRYAEHSHGSGPLIQTDPYQENGSTGRRVAPDEDDRENRQRVLAVQ